MGRETVSSLENDRESRPRALCSSATLPLDITLGRGPRCLKVCNDSALEIKPYRISYGYLMELGTDACYEEFSLKTKKPSDISENSELIW